MAGFDDVWSRIEACAGQQFHTKTELPFVYRVDGHSVIPDRTRYPIHVSQLQIAQDMMPLKGPWRHQHGDSWSGVRPRNPRGPTYSC